MAAHVRSLLVLAQAASASMRENGGGAIVAISSLGAHRVYDAYAAFGTAKAAIETLVTLPRGRGRAEGDPRQLRLRRRRPHRPLQGNPRVGVDRRRGAPSARRSAAPWTPTRSPSPVAFLLSDEARMVTGQTLTRRRRLHPARIARPTTRRRQSGLHRPQDRRRPTGSRWSTSSRARGPPVLLLHGFPEHPFSWRNQVDPIAAAGFRVIVPSQRGFAGTDAPADAADLQRQEPGRRRRPACSTPWGSSRRSGSATTGARCRPGTRACSPPTGCSASAASALPTSPGNRRRT